MIKTRNVNELQVGDVGKIVELATDDRIIYGKLMSLGIIPGISVRLLRRKPNIVLQAGYTKVALDHRLAVFIHVRLQ
ncbi:MAG: ferrous iron transport protein A [Firmicutes bacterium]|nr:ferrous iron transport protein A [Bacillota bacterium]